MKILISAIIMSLSLSVFADNLVLNENNTVVLNGEVSSQSLGPVSQALLSKCTEEKPELYLVLNSPGGDVIAGGQFISFVKGLNCKVHTVSLFAASMAYIIAERLDTRYVVDSSILMSHRMRMGISGQVPGEFVTQYLFYKSIGDELSKKVAERVGISFDEYVKLTYDELWLTGAQAVNKNHADKLVAVSCDKSLQGTKEQVFNTIFGPVTAVFSKCPLIGDPLEVRFGNKKAVEQFLKQFQEMNNLANSHK